MIGKWWRAWCAQSAARRRRPHHLQSEDLIDAQVGAEGVNKVTAIVSRSIAPDDYLELLVLLQQVVIIVVPQPGNGPEEVLNCLVFINIVNDYLVGAVGSQPFRCWLSIGSVGVKSTGSPPSTLATVKLICLMVPLSPVSLAVAITAPLSSRVLWASLSPE